MSDDEFGDEFDAINRTSLAPIGLTDERPKDQKSRFQLEVYNITNALRGQLGPSAITEILSHIDNLPKVEAKNPTAYVLGYVAYGGQRTVTRANAAKAFKLLPEVQDQLVTPPDVIRYARLWIQTTSEINDC